MKIVLAILVLTLSGCASYNTHLRTGCIWSCDQWKDYEYTPTTDTGTKGTVYQSSRTYITPAGTYMAIRSGSTTNIIQTSKGK